LDNFCNFEEVSKVAENDLLLQVLGSENIFTVGWSMANAEHDDDHDCLASDGKDVSPARPFSISSLTSGLIPLEHVEEVLDGRALVLVAGATVKR
jgi:hypothetical protein